jgi:geranylgeranyl diphosphate synthase, type II
LDSKEPEGRALEAMKRIERELERAIAYATATGCPPRIAAALRDSVFPGGARIRPRLAMAVAWACGDRNPQVADAAAASIEILHCASLVHDDMPCFDDAETRRGRPAVHKAHGEPIALLAGDALIVLAFETIARGCALRPHLLLPVLTTVARAVGTPNGIIAGQAWESEKQIDLRTYHRAKTGALFMAATAVGAIASDSEPQQWMPLGDNLGMAYQIADDLHDYAASSGEMGKPCGQDVVHGRPNAAAQNGVGATLRQLKEQVEKAVTSVPECPGADSLKAMIAGEALRLVPKGLVQSAA